ncbi:hypothetical protein F4819DRAFT_503803 [Hypoxylon fuscum]|nr:hypothetical protein F4819DRAFT_503803 [Hypoxylon fuscum]
MESTSSFNEAISLVDLPIELVRAVGSHLDSPSQLLKLACVCKRAYAAIDRFEIYKKDAVYQREIDDGTFVGYSGDGFIRSPISQPIILWLIINEGSIQDIKQCITVYQNVFPSALHESIDYQFSPMAKAIQIGRFDVVKAMVENGVPLQRKGLSSYQVVTDNNGESSSEEGDTEVSDDTDTVDSDTDGSDMADYYDEPDPFILACGDGRDEIACWMVSNGLGLTKKDLRTAVMYLCPQTVNVLLQHPVFNTDKRHSIIKAALECIDMPIAANVYRTKEETYHAKEETYKCLLAAATHPSFDKLSWLTRKVISLLDSSYCPCEFKNAKCLFRLLVDSDEFKTSQAGGQIARSAARADYTLDITKALFEKYPSSIATSEVDVLDETLRASACRGSIRTAQYLQSLGATFSRFHLEDAIYHNQFKMVDYIVSSGVSVSLDLAHPHGQKPLHLALYFRSDQSAFRLLHHGADITNIPESLRDLLYLDSISFQDQEQATLPAGFSRAEATAPDREVFGNASSVTYDGYLSEMFLIQRDAMFRLILGDNYREEALKRKEALKRDGQLDTYMDLARHPFFPTRIG